MSSSTWTKGPCSEKQSITNLLRSRRNPPAPFFLFIPSKYDIGRCRYSQWSTKAEGAASWGRQQLGALGTRHRGPGVNLELWRGTREATSKTDPVRRRRAVQPHGDALIPKHRVADYVRARWRGWYGIIWLVSGLGYSGLRSASSFSAGVEGVTTASGSSADILDRDTSYKHTAQISVEWEKPVAALAGGDRERNLGLRHTLYPRALSSLKEQGYRSMNLYRSTSKAVSLPSYSSLKAVNRLRSTFRILARSPMLLSKARNRAQISLRDEREKTQISKRRYRRWRWFSPLNRFATFTPISLVTSFPRWAPAQTEPWCCCPLKGARNTQEKQVHLPVLWQ